VRRLFTKRGLAAVCVPAAVLLLALGAHAYWTPSGLGSVTGDVGGLTSPSVSATSPTFGTAHVSWSAVTLVPSAPTADPEVTFIVERKPSSGSSWTAVCGTGTTPKPYDVLSCDDAPPSTGDYDYRVVARFRSWTSSGTASVHVVVDTVAPVSTITFPGAGPYSSTGWNAGCSSSICGTASDSGGSGLQKVEVSIRRGSGNYWDGAGAFSSASQVWNLVTGTASWSYAFPAANFPADGAYTVSVRATDNALNVQSSVTTQTFNRDTAAPVLGLSTIAATTGTGPAAFVRQGGGYHVYADASDASGLASFVADVSTVTTGQTAVPLAVCASSCTVGGHTYGYKSAVLTASSPLAQGSRSYTISAVDVVGNASAPASFAVQVDNTGPAVTTVIAATTGQSPQGFVKQGGTYRVYANASDLPAGPGASSGVDASTLSANVANVTSGLSATPLTACGSCGPGSAYAYQSTPLTASAVLSEGNKLYSVSAADNLGTSGTSTGANVQVDNTGPAVTTVIANTTTNEPGWLAQASGYRVYANVTDLPGGAGAASGVNTSTITANVSSVTTGQTAVALTTAGCPCTIGGTSYAYRSAQLTSNNPLTAGSKAFTVAAADNLGTATSQGAAVTIDNTAPRISTLQMFDVDTDGRVDRVQATFNEPLETPYSAPNTVWTLANMPGGAANTLASVAVASPVATLTLNEGTVNTANGSFTMALAANANGIRDLAGNQASFAATSVADRAAPVATSVVLANGLTVGRARRDDTVTVTYSEALDATSFCSTWANGSTQTLGGNGVVDVLITDTGANDVLTVADVGAANCGGAANFRFGSVNLAEDYVDENELFLGNNANQSTLVWSPTARTLTITLGSGNGSERNVPVSAPIYTPNAALRDLAGNTMAAVAFTALTTSRF
jgi:hypothetical protein